MKYINYLLICVLISSSACHRAKSPDSELKSPAISNHHNDKIEAEVKFKNDYMTLGVLYHQQSAEYEALCYQAYNLGKIILDKDLANKEIDKHRAVVLDIDETVLDNSPYEAECIISNINYPSRWDEWCLKAEAEAIPGALDFLNYARMNGVSIFYITNRKDYLKKATIENLKKQSFPQADEEHVITRSDINSKEPRRQKVLEKHHISVLFGDNLSDFSNVFDEKSNTERIASVNNLKAEFGNRFIVLPNSMYGDWETALYGLNRALADSTKQALRISGLKGF